MKKLFIITMALCSLTLLGTSCKEKKFKGFEQTENGLYYKFVSQNKEARAVQPNEYLFLTVSYRTDNDSMTLDERDVVDMMRESVYKGDLYEGYKLLHEGDEVIFALKADTFMLYAGYPELPSFINENTMIFFNIKVNKIRSEKEMDEEKDEEIRNYMSQHNLTAEPTESGLYFIETEPGKGKEIFAGDSLSINYVFRLANDSIFDSSEGRGPLYCIVGQMFPGLNEGLCKMKRGGKATLIMPYKIAFGVQNPYIPVPPFSTIIAEIEVLPNIVRPATAPVPTVME